MFVRAIGGEVVEPVLYEILRAVGDGGFVGECWSKEYQRCGGGAVLGVWPWGPGEAVRVVERKVPEGSKREAEIEEGILPGYMWKNIATRPFPVKAAGEEEEEEEQWITISVGSESMSRGGCRRRRMKAEVSI